MALDTALKWRQPPHRYWNVPGDEFTTEDLIASQAHTVVESMKCRCGCSGWADECRNEDLQDRWQVSTGYHYRGRALEQYRENHKEDMKEPGAFAYISGIDDE